MQGRVKVNGEPAKIGQKADPKTDKIAVDGRPLHSQKKRYFLLYKPRGYVTTMKDEFSRPCITELLQSQHIRERLFTVGRLDFDSEGLIIVTNDGELANKIAHPSFEIEKTYRVILGRALNDKDGKRIEKGVPIDGKKVKVSELQVMENPKHIEMTIHEGRNRIIRRLMERMNYNVLRLVRIKIGKISIRGLKEGMFREVSREEIEGKICPKATKSRNATPS